MCDMLGEQQASQRGKARKERGVGEELWGEFKLCRSFVKPMLTICHAVSVTFGRSLTLCQ